MLVNANVSKEVFDYFAKYNISDVVDTLLEMYDFTNLPQISGKREKEIRGINISNELYITLYKLYGPRSKKVSIGRLLEFAYSMDVLALPRFKIFEFENIDNPIVQILDKAYRALLSGKEFDNSEEYNSLVELCLTYKKHWEAKLNDSKGTLI